MWQGLLGTLAVAFIILAGAVLPCAAEVEGPTSLLNSDFAADHDESAFADDFNLRVAGDGNGHWVALWSSEHFQGTVVSRSQDNGRTWSSASLLVLDRAPYALEVSTDGTWLAVIGGETWRSNDLGETWVQAGSTGFDVRGGLERGALATDDEGNWMFLYYGAGIGPDADILRTTSSDNGVSWSTPALITPTWSATDLLSDRSPGLATDGQGHWVVVWAASTGIAVASSDDFGATWTDPPVIVGGTSNPHPFHTIATDGMGRWILVEDRGQEATILTYSISEDGGASWESRFLPSTASGEHGNRTPTIATDHRGNWHIAYGTDDPLGTIGTDVDLVVVTSRDGGETWSQPAPVSERAAGSTTQGYSYRPQFAFDGQDSWILAWLTKDTFDGAAGDDDDYAYLRWRDDCPTEPATGCQTPTRPRQSKLKMRSRDTARDQFIWKWRSSEAVDAADFGDPAVDAGYHVCVYDQAAGQYRLALEMDAGAAAASAWACPRCRWRWRRRSRCSS
jgi:hypothetical protein